MDRVVSLIIYFLIVVVFVLVLMNLLWSNNCNIPKATEIPLSKPPKTQVIQSPSSLADGSLGGNKTLNKHVQSTMSKQVYLVIPPREKNESVFSADVANKVLHDFHEFNVELATMSQVKEAVRIGAYWNYPGWTKEGKSVIPNLDTKSVNERYTSVIPGYLLYGYKPLNTDGDVTTTIMGYTVVPWFMNRVSESQGVWSL